VWRGQVLLVEFWTMFPTNQVAVTADSTAFMDLPGVTAVFLPVSRRSTPRYRVASGRWHFLFRQISDADKSATGAR